MDKPVEGCDADMGMLLMLCIAANILPHLAARSIPFFALQLPYRDKIRPWNDVLSRNR